MYDDATPYHHQELVNKVINDYSSLLLANISLSHQDMSAHNQRVAGHSSITHQ